MDLFSELITAVQQDLNIDDNSTLYPLTRVKAALNRSNRKATGLFPWPETEDAKKTSTVNGQYYYDYPDNWRPDSMWRLEVDGVMYGEDPDGSPMAFEDYLIWKKKNPTSTEKKWATQWRRFFITPTPTSDGTNNICVWGLKVVPTLSSNGDVTIFSYSLPECNEAIVMEAEAILQAQGEDKGGSEFKSASAKEILAVAWTRIKKEQAKYEKTQPMFNVPDFFHGRNSRQLIGDFDI